MKDMIQRHLKCEKNKVNHFVLLPGDIERAKHISSHFFNSSIKISENREFHIYNGIYQNKPVAVCSTGIGCMSASVAIEELVNCGCQYFIRVGTCGALSPKVNIGDIIIVSGAVRGDGASKEYIPLAYPAVADHTMVNILKKEAEKKNIRYHAGIIRTHDAFYMESPFAFGDWKKRTKIWTETGVLGVENEASTLFVIGSLRKVKVGAVLVAVGHLLNRKKLRKENLQNSMDKAIIIACKTLVELQINKETYNG